MARPGKMATCGAMTISAGSFRMAHSGVGLRAKAEKGQTGDRNDGSPDAHGKTDYYAMYRGKYVAPCRTD